LKEADSDFEDVSQMIVYLRDASDYQIINDYIKSKYKLPCIIVHAPVCRPGWLIEIECVAVKTMDNSDFKPF
jgi:enamine deaminase RidA (YjgF/YER057c/UK114 family)